MNSLKDAPEGAKFTSTPEAAPPSSEPGSTPPWAKIDASAPPERIRHFALCSDWTILLNAADLEGFDLTRREVFVGVVLTPQEARYVYERLVDRASEAAAWLLAALKRSLKRTGRH